MPTVELTRAEHLAVRVCEARDDMRLSNAELARRAGVPRRTIVRITNAHNKTRVNQETLEALAAATGKPVSFFSSDPTSRVAEAAEKLVSALVEDLTERLRESLAAQFDEVQL